MIALQATGYGRISSKRLKFNSFEPRPLGNNEVLINIKAAGINPADYKIINGHAFVYWRWKRPFSVGFDYAGVIEDPGNNTRFKKGEEVFGKVTWHEFGTIATHIVVHIDSVAKKPQTLDFVESAAIPLAAATALQSLQKAKVKKGDKVLIHAGSGGVGSFAVQMAKQMGATVFTTTSSANVDWVKQLGADVVIDYKQENYRKVCAGVDVVIDTLGYKYNYESAYVVKRKGRIVSVAGHINYQTTIDIGLNPILRYLNWIKGSPLMAYLQTKSAQYAYVWTNCTEDSLNEISAMIDTGSLKVVIDRVYPFAQAIEALQHVANGHTKGKVVVQID